MEAKRRTGTREWSTVSKNIFTGCRHNCKYGYCRAMALRYKWISKPEDWMDMKFREKSFYEKPRFYKGVLSRILFPSMHDIFPEHLDVTITYLKKWLDAGNSILIVSKPHLECIMRLCDELEPYKEQLTFRFTIGSMNDDVLRFWEPNAPPFSERMQSLKYAYKKSYKTSVSSEPYLDSKIGMLVDAVTSYVNDTIWIGLMNRIEQRLDTTGWTEKDFKYLEDVRNCQTKDFVERLYDELRGNKKIRWKDSIKSVLGLPEEEIG